MFAASSDPLMLDPALASDGETFRVARQKFEGLIGAEPGTTDVEPLLATAWEAAADNKSLTFTLREGVKFSDGTDFNAERSAPTSSAGSTGPASTRPRTSPTTTAS